VIPVQVGLAAESRWFLLLLEDPLPRQFRFRFQNSRFVGQVHSMRLHGGERAARGGGERGDTQERRRAGRRRREEERSETYKREAG
jgi:hypothetical protein